MNLVDIILLGALLLWLIYSLLIIFSSFRENMFSSFRENMFSSEGESGCAGCHGCNGCAGSSCRIRKKKTKKKGRRKKSVPDGRTL